MMEGAVLTPDLRQARAFLTALAGMEPVTFQTFDDNSSGQVGLAKVLHGTLDEHAAELIRLNQQGAGVFVMVNRGDGVVKEGRKTCRTNDNVVAVRALFVDLDGAPVEPLLRAKVPPSILVESSTGKFHGYWPTSDTSLEEFSSCQEALAHQFAGDSSVKDLARVMRIPGFYHRKEDPVMTRLLVPSLNNDENDLADSSGSESAVFPEVGCE